MTSIRERYLAASGSFIDLAHGLEAENWEIVVPCTPRWTARDLLSHVSGIPDDALAGRVDGIATDPWTASQVDRNASFTVDELLARWERQREPFADALEAMGEDLATFDCHSHEHDLRHALARPSNRESDLVTMAGRGLAHVDAPVGVRVELSDGPSAGPDDASVTVSGLSTFEVFRSRLGRRSRVQVESYDWTGDPADVTTAIDHWFRFGPNPTDIHE